MWYRRGAEKHFAFLDGGFAEVLPDRVSILAQVAERAEDIDLAPRRGRRSGRAEDGWLEPRAESRARSRDYSHVASARASRDSRPRRMQARAWTISDGHSIAARACRRPCATAVGTAMLRISSAVASHPGLRREENEDAYCVRPDLGLYMVADGMGGHAAGEVASRLAVEAVEAFVDDTRDGRRQSHLAVSVRHVALARGQSADGRPPAGQPPHRRRH